jgi:pimeloyl-ACP methyl ester carboxylesterase
MKLRCSCAQFTSKKFGEPELPVYRSDRGDIYLDRIQSQAAKLSSSKKFKSEVVVQPRTIDQWTEVDGLKVRFQKTGSGPAMVLVHGLLGYLFSWRFAAPLLSQDRQVFALDMPGAGFSDCKAGIECRLRAAAQRLLGFMNALEISGCDLVGSSYGGTTALMAAALAPSRIRTLILVSPANPWSRAGRKRLGILRLSPLAALFPMIARPFLPLDWFFIRRMYGDPMRMTSETIQGYRLPLARPGVLEHAVEIVRTWSADMHDLRQALAAITNIPVLLVWGSKDRVVDLASAKVLSQQVHAVRTEVIPGAGHLPYEEEPQEFSRIVLDFLAQYSSVDALRRG